MAIPLKQIEQGELVKEVINRVSELEYVWEVDEDGDLMPLENPISGIRFTVDEDGDVQLV